MRNTLLIFVLAGATVAASAQTKVAGTIECGKPDPQQMVSIPDKPNHSYMIAQQKCTWTKPMEINGVKTKEAVFTASSEVNGERTNSRGFSFETLDNGDKMEVRTQDKGTMKDNNMESDGKWTIARGTGKARGLK